VKPILKRTLVGGALAAAVVALLWLAKDSENGAIVLFTGTLLSVLGMLELAGMGKLRGAGLAWSLLPAALVLLGWNLFLTGLVGGGPEFAPRLEPGELALSYVLVALAVGAAWFARLRTGEPRAGLFTHLGAGLWLVFPLPALVHVWCNYELGGLIALLVLSKVGDIAGYYVGNAIGKHHPFPNLSKGKTVEGCAGSLVAGTLAGGVFVGLGLLPDFPFGWTGGFVAGLIVNLAAQAGDLLESAVKRRAEVKDSGSWFGPSGGVLDLVDSLLLTVPTALVVWPLIFA
jgi:CDP-diglyceride synthetase